MVEAVYKNVHLNFRNSRKIMKRSKKEQKEVDDMIRQTMNG
jgi:hypothetical protein